MTTCLICDQPLAQYGCVVGSLAAATFVTCHAPPALRRSAEAAKPQFAVCRPVAEATKEEMPDGAIVRLCGACGTDIWVSPSTRAVERKLGKELPTICRPCYAPRPGDMGIVTEDAAREAAALRRRGAN